MELKEGMFVRTKTGTISKFESYTTDKKRTCETDKLMMLDVENIIKASFNIIDLIEVGDYVNGYKVYKAKDTYYSKLTDEPLQKRLRINGNFLDRTFIKSIVTKEQFEQMTYKVGE